MRKPFTFIIGILLILSVLAGCQNDMSEDDSGSDMSSMAQGTMTLGIINDNRYSIMEGINAPEGRIVFMLKEDIWYLSLMDDFKLSDEGDITIFASKKDAIMSADDLKDDSYEISELTSKEGAQEYRINENIPVDEIMSVGFFDKENNMLVAWATFN